MASEIKKYFISRWEDDGVIMNADFSQLEVIVLAHLTGDEQLMYDIQSGLDMHTVRAAQLFGIPEKDVTSKQRKTAKAFSFQLQYGSGARNMAETQGVAIDLAKDFIAQYYDRYQGVKAWQDTMADTVESSAVTVPLRTPKGFPMKKGWVMSETGRRYMFKQGDAPEFMAKRGTMTSFKPTEIKNYPVQGLATGDIVPMMLGEVWRWLIASKYHEDALLINTVHDSIMLDVKKDVVIEVATHVKKIMENAPTRYESRFGIKFSLPLGVDVTWGPNWAEDIYSIDNTGV